MSFNLVLVPHQQLLRTLLRVQLLQTLEALTALEYSSIQPLTNAPASLGAADLLLVDADQAEGSPLAALQAILRFRPSIRIALITDTKGAYLVESVYRLGLRGLLHKRDSWETLLRARYCTAITRELRFLGFMDRRRISAVVTFVGYYAHGMQRLP
jgi:DNA-binding NarL/FixJ family response regulator